MVYRFCIDVCMDCTGFDRLDLGCYRFYLGGCWLYAGVCTCHIGLFQLCVLCVVYVWNGCLCVV